MARVTAAEVKEIIDTTVDPTPFITSANLLVTAHVSGNGPSDDLCKEIERWLAAHLICIRDPRERNKNMGSSGVGFEGRFHFGEGLKGTQYGQQVLVLDSSGRLASIGKQRASLELL